MRVFNAAGPCLPSLHLHVDAAARLPEAEASLLAGVWVLLTGPVGAGRSTFLADLRADFVELDDTAVLSASLDLPGAAEGDGDRWECALLGALRRRASLSLPETWGPPEGWPSDALAGDRVARAIGAWSAAAPVPMLLLLDDADALSDAALLSLVSQLERAHAASRPGQRLTVALALAETRLPLVRAAWTGQLAPAPAPLALPDLTPAQLDGLLIDFSLEAGLRLSEGARRRFYALTLGRAWLVGALGRELTLVSHAVDLLEEPQVEMAATRLLHSRLSAADAIWGRGAGLVRALLDGESVDEVALGALGLLAGDPPRPGPPLLLEALRAAAARQRLHGLQHPITPDWEEEESPGSYRIALSP